MNENDGNATPASDGLKSGGKSGNGSESSPMHGKTILAIEDEWILSEYLQMMLGESGHKVIMAADGREGIQRYMENRGEIGLVLLDMGLPEMSGEEVLSTIVRVNPGAKVVAVSGPVEPEVQASVLKIGAADYLGKPYLAEELLRKVDNLLH